MTQFKYTVKVTFLWNGMTAILKINASNIDFFIVQISTRMWYHTGSWLGTTNTRDWRLNTTISYKTIVCCIFWSAAGQNLLFNVFDTTSLKEKNSNIESKSSNNPYLNIIQILFLLFLFNVKPLPASPQNIYFANFATFFNLLVPFITFFMQKMWKGIFQPAFGVPNTQMLSKIHNT